MVYIAIDPGISTGIAIFGDDGELNWFQTEKYENIYKWLETLDAQIITDIIMEDYRLNPPNWEKHEAIHSKMETTKVMGKIELWCEQNDIKLHEQARQFKSVGYKYWGKEPLPKSNPLNHAWDAVAHGMYWLVRNHKINPRSLLKPPKV